MLAAALSLMMPGQAKCRSHTWLLPPACPGMISKKQQQVCCCATLRLGNQVQEHGNPTRHIIFILVIQQCTSVHTAWWVSCDCLLALLLTTLAPCLGGSCLPVCWLLGLQQRTDPLQSACPSMHIYIYSSMGGLCCPRPWKEP